MSNIRWGRFVVTVVVLVAGGWGLAQVLGLVAASIASLALGFTGIQATSWWWRDGRPAAFHHRGGLMTRANPRRFLILKFEVDAEELSDAEVYAMGYRVAETVVKTEPLTFARGDVATEEDRP